MTREEAKARVARGVALLDEKNPGWVEALSLEDLEMEYGCSCILGQLHGDFRDGMQRLFGRRTCRRNWPAAEAHGFYINDDQDTRYTKMRYGMLQCEWEQVILSRLPHVVIRNQACVTQW